MAKKFEIKLEINLNKIIEVVANSNDEALTKAEKYSEGADLTAFAVGNSSAQILSSKPIEVDNIYLVILDLIDGNNDIVQKGNFSFVSRESAIKKLNELVKQYRPFMVKNTDSWIDEEDNSDTKYGGYDEGYERQHHLYVYIEQQKLNY